MVDTVGTKLQRARKLRKLSLEDASRATKIRVNQLVDLESDDYSNFANLAYARSFLVGYSKYLHVEARPYLDAFADANTFGLDDYQYLSETPVGIYRAPTRQQVRRKPQRHQFVWAAMGLGVLTILAFVWMVAITLQRLPDWDKLAARQEARERAARGTTEAANQPPAAMSPAQAPTVAVPVSDPASAPANHMTPVPSIAPVDEPVRTLAATLAATDSEVVPSGNPALPVPGDGHTVRQMLQPMAPRPVAALTAGRLADTLQPQKVVNNQPRN